MTAIRLFYHGPNKGKINFGDALSPILVEEITGRNVVYASILRCDLIAVGSILDIYYRWRIIRHVIGLDNDVIVWGSGFIKEGPCQKSDGLIIAAVRGPETRKRLGLSPDTPLGDPGLLASRIVQRATVPRYGWGIIPHLADARDARVGFLLQETKNSTLIHLGQDPRQTLDQISQCERIVSSSLHGLIVADSLGIPNWRIEFGNRLIGGSWKFNDYFNSVNRLTGSPIMFPKSGNLGKEILSEDFSYWNDIPKLCHNLSDALKRFY